MSALGGIFPSFIFQNIFAANPTQEASLCLIMALRFYLIAQLGEVIYRYKHSCLELSYKCDKIWKALMKASAKAAAAATAAF